ncbi:MAG TPA: adenosylmethionine decarboxylase [Planctomycetaceae bacterium]|jgi:S-adenosylmethionine decarboxylase|nr:adenosylmethionine decarboxylase [Planctomycetaceae bacterium]
MASGGEVQEVAYASGRVYELEKGKHLLVDCRNVSRDVCLNDGAMLAAMARGAKRAGANVISQVRYQFGHNSPPGFTAVVVLDESHCSCHTYADLGLVALDVFTCGRTDPQDVLAYIREEIELGDVSIRQMPRFLLEPQTEGALEEEPVATST